MYLGLCRVSKNRKKRNQHASKHPVSPSYYEMWHRWCQGRTDVLIHCGNKQNRACSDTAGWDGLLGFYWFELTACICSPPEHSLEASARRSPKRINFLSVPNFNASKVEGVQGQSLSATGAIIHDIIFLMHTQLAVHKHFVATLLTPSSLWRRCQNIKWNSSQTVCYGLIRFRLKCVRRD